MEAIEDVAETTVEVNFLGVTAEAIVGDTNQPGGGTVTDLVINQAIKDAINNDEYLSDLLVAEDGPSGALVVTALTDGDRELDDLDISFTSAVSNAQDANVVTPLDVADLGTRYNTAFADDGGDIDGDNSSESANQNTVLDGAGEDTIVLSTAAGAEETVRLSQDGEVDVIVNASTDDALEIEGDVGAEVTINEDGATEFKVGDDVEALFADDDAAGNVLLGAGGDDTITGGDEADGINGGAGDDTIDGGAGADTIDGGAGADTIVNLDIDNNGTDAVTFVSGTDTFQFSAADLNALTGTSTFSSGDAVPGDAGEFAQFIDGDGNVGASGTAGTFIYNADNGELIFDASGDTSYDDTSGTVTDTAGDDIVIADLGAGADGDIVAADIAIIA